jgi:hypothetical protein
MPEPKSYVDHAHGGVTVEGLLFSEEEIQDMDEAQVQAAASESFYIVDTDVNTKQEARDGDVNRYWSGKPCKNNHLSDRYLKGQCIQCFRAAVKRRRQTDHGKEVYQASRKRAMGRRKERSEEATAE